MRTSLCDFVWDQLAAARDLNIELIKDDAAGAEYRVTLTIGIDAERQAFLSERSKQHRSPTGRIKRIVRHGLELFFADDSPA